MYVEKRGKKIHLKIQSRINHIKSLLISYRSEDFNLSNHQENYILSTQQAYLCSYV